MTFWSLEEEGAKEQERKTRFIVPRPQSSSLVRLFIRTSFAHSSFVRSFAHSNSKAKFKEIPDLASIIYQCAPYKCASRKGRSPRP